MKPINGIRKRVKWWIDELRDLNPWGQVNWWIEAFRDPRKGLDDDPCKAYLSRFTRPETMNLAIRPASVIKTALTSGGARQWHCRNENLNLRGQTLQGKRPLGSGRKAGGAWPFTGCWGRLDHFLKGWGSLMGFTPELSTSYSATAPKANPMKIKKRKMNLVGSSLLVFPMMKVDTAPKCGYTRTQLRVSLLRAGLKFQQRRMTCR